MSVLATPLFALLLAARPAPAASSREGEFKPLAQRVFSTQWRISRPNGFRLDKELSGAKTLAWRGEERVARGFAGETIWLRDFSHKKHEHCQEQQLDCGAAHRLHGKIIEGSHYERPTFSFQCAPDSERSARIHKRLLLLRGGGCLLLETGYLSPRRPVRRRKVLQSFRLMLSTLAPADEGDPYPAEPPAPAELGAQSQPAGKLFF